MGTKNGELLIFDRVLKVVRELNKVSSASIKHIEIIK